MSSGIWTSVSGAAAQSQSVDTIANNLANSDTVGFKDLPTFKEYLATAERVHDGAPLQPGPVRNRDLYPLDGRDQSFVVVNGTYTNFRPGAVRVTQGQLDLALDGPGFLEVSTPAGIRYTRAGSLKMAADGRLVTAEGNPVLSAGAQGLAAAATGGSGADAARFISLRDRGAQFSINGSGEIYAGDQLVARLSVVEFQDLNKLRKAGGSLFAGDPANALPEPSHTQVRQGMIELSNVNPIEEMTNLIKANRLFEQDLKAMKTYGEIMGKEANDVGKL